MIGYKVTISGDEAVQKALTAVAARVQDMTPLMRQVAQVLKFASEEAFEGEKNASTGASWTRLAPATVRSYVTKTKRRGEHPILQVTGRLAASLTTMVGKAFALIGTNVVYAAIHQFGGFAGRNLRTQIPARPYIGLTTTDMSDIEKAAVAFLARAFPAGSGA